MSRHVASTTKALGIALAWGGLLATPALAQTSPEGPIRRLSIQDAVSLALEQNLTVQVERLNPRISDLSIAQARTAWTPSIGTTFSTTGTDSPVNSFLVAAEGGANKTTDRRLTTEVSYTQLFEWGGAASASWDNSRQTSNSLFTNFNPTVRSNMSFQCSQPLLRNREIDSARQQLLVTNKNREISDVQFRQTVVTTTRSVKSAYWDFAYAVGSLALNQQSLNLARQSLRDTRARVEIGTMAPIDIVEADAEVAAREEGVIVAQAAIEQAEDRLRALILDPSAPDFWGTRLELTDTAPFQVAPIDLDAAVRNALDVRTDLRQARKSLESNDINLRYARNQTLPDVDVQVNYGVTGLGGTQFVRGAGFPGPIVDQINRGYGSVLGDLLKNDFPNWSLSLSIGYPIGQANAEANLARARLQYQQSEIQIKNIELQVATQVRDAARQVNTNAKRVETTRAARELNERRLQAEQRKFAAGTSTSFFVFQAQRDLAQAQNNELRATLDYSKSLVDFETVQESSLGGGSGTITVAASGASAAGAATLQQPSAQTQLPF